MPYRNEANAVLTMWREVERRLAATPEGPEHTALLADAARLRTEHQRLTDLARQHHRPGPDPWPAPDGDASKAPPTGRSVGEGTT